MTLRDLFDSSTCEGSYKLSVVGEDCCEKEYLETYACGGNSPYDVPDEFMDREILYMYPEIFRDEVRGILSARIVIELKEE